MFDDIDISEIIPIIALGAVQEAQTRRPPRGSGYSGADYPRDLLNYCMATKSGSSKIRGVDKNNNLTITSATLRV